MGELGLDALTLCWSWTVEASIALTIGIKVFGLRLGISLAITGNSNLQQVTYEEASADGYSNYLFEDGSRSKSRCLASPLALIWYWIKSAAKAIVGSKKVQNSVSEESIKFSEDEEKGVANKFARYAWLLE